MWRTETPEPQPEQSVISCGHIQLSVGQAHDSPQRWEYFSLSFGRFSNEPHKECLKTWPREALRLARENLDQFEEQLDEED